MFSDEKKAELLEQFDSDYSDLVNLAHRIGPQAMDQVFEVFGGLKPHIPESRNFWTTLWRETRNREIRARFRGDNYAELAVVYNMTDRQVRNIINNAERPANRPKIKRATIKVDRGIYNQLYEYAREMDLSLADVASKFIAGAMTRP